MIETNCEEVPDLEILSPTEAAEELDNVKTAVLGNLVPFNTIVQLTTGLYADGYVLARTSSSAMVKLRESFDQNKNAMVSGIMFFNPEYSASFLLARAEKQGLPVAFIKGKILDLSTHIFCKGYIFGSSSTVEISAKLKKLFEDDTKRVLINFKPAKGADENVNQVGQVQAGSDVPDSGTGN